MTRRQMITANRLTDGIVVYLGADGTWHEEIAEASAAETDEAAAELERIAAADEAACRVVGPYLMEIDGAGHRPARLRESIRAVGPTVQTGLNGQRDQSFG